MDTLTTRIVSYRSSHQPWFEKLNRHWIEKYFWMEPLDFEILQNPEAHIIEKGGAIFMAEVGEEVAGTVALRFIEPSVFEFTKMAVDEKFRGRQIGKLLSLAAIEHAQERGAAKIFLYSKTVLAGAIELYRKLGFVEVPVDGPYKRSNIKMELLLNK